MVSTAAKSIYFVTVPYRAAAATAAGATTTTKSFIITKYLFQHSSNQLIRSRCDRDKRRQRIFRRGADRIFNHEQHPIDPDKRRYILSKF